MTKRAKNWVTFNRAFVTTMAIGGLAAPLLTTNAQAAGLQLLPGSPNFGTAGAGHAAAGIGAGSAWANPATMTLNEGRQIAGGFIAAKTEIEFDAADKSANSGGDAGGEIYIPSFSYIDSLSERLKFGFSVVVPFGNSLDYDDDWAGSNVATDASTETIQVMPSLAYRINQQFSIGFGVTANHTAVEQKLSMTITPRLKADAALEADGIDYGWTLGGLYELNERHRLGIVYRSQIDSDLSGDGAIGNDVKDTDLNWENPASIVLSGYHQVSDKVTLLWDIGRTFYSAFKETTVHIDGFPDIDLHRNWQDANRYAVGSHYQLTDTIILQAGYSFEESTVETADRSVDLPLDNIQRYTIGAMYKVSESTDIALGLEYADLGTPEIKANGDPLFSSPDGEYNNSAVAASISFNYKF